MEPHFFNAQDTDFNVLVMGKYSIASWQLKEEISVGLSSTNEMEAV
jgi:hypothetical protein